jgi:hypothetical protein
MTTMVMRAFGGMVTTLIQVSLPPLPVGSNAVAQPLPAMALSSASARTTLTPSRQVVVSLILASISWARPWHNPRL